MLLLCLCLALAGSQKGWDTGLWSLSDPGQQGCAGCFDPFSSLLAFPICCLCRLGNCDNSSSWDWKWRVVENHGPGVKHVGFNNSKTGAWASSSDERRPRRVWTACRQWDRVRCTLQAGCVLSLEWRKQGVKVGLCNFTEESPGLLLIHILFVRMCLFMVLSCQQQGRRINLTVLPFPVSRPFGRGSTYSFSVTPLNNSVRKILIPIFQIKVLRLREAQWFVQDHTAPRVP